MADNLNVGGRIAFTVDGTPYHPAGNATVKEGGIEADAVANMDNTIGRVVKSGMWEVEISIRQWKGLNPLALLNGTFNFSMYEEELGRTLLLTNAFAKGKPSRNTENGEITGLTIVCAGPQGRYVS